MGVGVGKDVVAGRGSSPSANHRGRQLQGANSSDQKRKILTTAL